MRSWWMAWVLGAAALCGCRADVEGMWEGHVGSRAAILSLDQKGSAISGEVCFGSLCDDISDGTLDERSLVLSYGCRGCALPKATLDLVLGGELEGEQHVWDCECTPEDDEAGVCGCRDVASFQRCVGGC